MKKKHLCNKKRCKGIEKLQKSENHFDNLVDLAKCCEMSIWTQNLASIQPRTSLSKFAKK